VDFSLIEHIRAAHPRRTVRAIMFVRHPVSLFFSEFLYKKHCLWRQQGRRAPDGRSRVSLVRHIARLRAQAERRLPLTLFLAGASWCSCADDRSARSALPSATLRRRALVNAATYAVIGTLELIGPSMRLLSHLLGGSGFNAYAAGRALAAGEHQRHVNALAQCVPDAALPADDLPTAAQRAEVAELLAEDTRLYEALDRRLRQRLEAVGIRLS
jgi:hypothetical protein